jgi:hypothetical protein
MATNKNNNYFGAKRSNPCTNSLGQVIKAEKEVKFTVTKGEQIVGPFETMNLHHH